MKKTKPESITKNLDKITKQFKKDLSKASSSKQLSQIYSKYLSKNSGATTELIGELPKLNLEQKKKFGPLLNQLKNKQKQSIKKKEKALKNSESTQDIDLTTLEKPEKLGSLHPTTRTIREMNKFFRYHGYSIAEGPEIETAEYNFRKLNLPEGHPATDLQDTLFIQKPNILLRTHTSSVEARILDSHKPPIRVVVPGKVYRNETANKTNSSFFHHYQGVVVDKGITLEHLKSTLALFHKFLFGQEVKLRFRYKYYPEVSPGMGVDMQCQFCQGKGCETCKYRGWIEVLGSGMIHYNTLKSCNIDPEEYTGFAFGMGLDRLVMSRFNITDIRELYGERLTYL